MSAVGAADGGVLVDERELAGRIIQASQVCLLGLEANDVTGYSDLQEFGGKSHE